MSEKPVPKIKVSAKKQPAKKSGTDFDIDVSLSGLDDGTKDQRDAAAAFAVGGKREEIISRSRNGEDIEQRIRQETEWEADGEGETEMDIPALPPKPEIPKKTKEEDHEIRMLRFLNGEIKKAEVFLEKVKSDPKADPEVIRRAENALEAHRQHYQQFLEQMQDVAAASATDASLDDAFADIMQELNKAGFEATGSAEDFPTEEQAEAARRQDELSRIRMLVTQMKMSDEEGNWVIRQSEHLREEADRKQLIDYLQKRQKETLMEFLKWKEENRKEEQETAVQNEIIRRQEVLQKQKEIGDFIMDTIVEGKGARIENLEAFEKQGGKVYEADIWGMRKIEWNKKFNAIDGDNRLIRPMVGEDWFDDMGEFHPWFYKQSPNPREKKLMAPVGKDGKHFFLTVDGELFPMQHPMKELRAFIENKEEAEVADGEPAAQETAEPAFVYAVILAEELAAFAQRFDKTDQQALLILKDQILAVKEAGGKSDWNSVLSAIKERVKNASLGPNVAFIKDRLFLRLAKTARAYDADLDFNGLAELDDYHWEHYGRYDQGVIIRYQKDDKEQFTLVRDGKLLYSMDEALDSVDLFTGKVARVSGQRGKMALYNFILKENGDLLSEDWFKFIYPPAQGMFRLRTLDDRFNYLDPETGAFLSETGYDEAGDFDKNGKALVKQGGEKFYIDRKGSRLEPIRVAASMVVDRHFDTTKTGPIPTITELKARIRERTQETKDRHISYQLRSRFQELLRSHPEEKAELYRLFSVFRRTINAQADGRKNGKRIQEDHLIKALSVKVGQSALSRGPKQTLKNSVFDIRHKKPVWGKVEPLPVSLITAFEPVIKAHPDEEQALLSLIARLEMKLQLAPVKENRLRALRSDLRRLIFSKECRLAFKTKRAIFDRILTMMNNSDIRWGASPADRRGLKKERIKRQIIRLCALAEGGNIDEAYQGFRTLVSAGNSRQLSALGKSAFKPLAMSFYQALYELSQAYQTGGRKTALAEQYREGRKKVLEVLQHAHNADPEDIHIRQLIDFLIPPKKPLQPETAAETPLKPAKAIRKRSRLWSKLILVGLAGGMAFFIDSHTDRENPAMKRSEVSRIDKGGQQTKGLSQLGDLHIKQEHFRAAANAYRNALKLNPKNPDYHAIYGQILIRLNHLKGARWHLERALELDPDHSLARRELDKLETNK